MEELGVYYEKLKEVQIALLNYINEQTDVDDNFRNFLTKINDYFLNPDNIAKDRLKLFLCFLCSVSNNYHRGPYFFDKIERILITYKNQIIQLFSKAEIFEIFKSNKRLILFLVEEDMIQIDMPTLYKINNQRKSDKNYFCYFYPEMIPNPPENFEEKRKIGENDSYICSLIRNDNVEDFIALINRKQISLSAKIKESVFETNSFLINKEPTLIEYAAFFGSIQIFNYLKFNGVELTESLWLFAIHSSNAEIIHLLEQNISNSNAKDSISSDNADPDSDHIDQDSDLGIDLANNYIIQNDQNTDDIFSLSDDNINQNDQKTDDIISLSDDNNQNSDHDYINQNDQYSNNADPTFDQNHQNTNKVIFMKCLEESIKCHHNDFSEYIINTYFPNKDIISHIQKTIIEFYNFSFLQLISAKSISIHCLIDNDYLALFKKLLNEKEIDVNHILIYQ